MTLKNKKKKRKMWSLYLSNLQHFKRFFYSSFKLFNFRVGILGQPMKLFHVKTLAPLGNNEDEPNNEHKTE